jgi:hypothetical protein
MKKNKKILISEISRNLELMGINKSILIEGIGSLGVDLARFLSGASKVSKEFTNQFGAKVTKTVRVIANKEFDEYTFNIFEQIANGTRRIDDLISSGQSKIVDDFFDIIKTNQTLVDEYYTHFISEMTQRLGYSEKDLLIALKGSTNLQDELFQMTNNKLLANFIVDKVSKQLYDITISGKLTGTLEDNIKDIVSRRWSSVLNDLNLEPEVLTALQKFMLTDNFFLKQVREILFLTFRQGGTKVDNVIENVMKDFESIFTEMFQKGATIPKLSEDLSSYFKRLNIDMTKLGKENYELIKKTFIDRISTLEFNIGGLNRKLSSDELSEIKRGIDENKILADDYTGLISKLWDSTYYKKFLTDSLKDKFKRFTWFVISGLLRKWSDWKDIFVKIATSDNKLMTAGKEYIKIASAISFGGKIVAPIIYSIFALLWQMCEWLGTSGDRDDLYETIKNVIYNQFKEAWQPTSSDVWNMVEIIIPLHAPPIVKIKGMFESIASDDINLDDYVEDIMEKYDLSKEEAQKILAWIKDNQINLEELSNIDELDKLKSLTNSEESFRLFCRIKKHQYISYNKLTGLGSATVNGENKTFMYDDTTDGIQTFKQL